jgi:pullulanase/glycogen debranching enzyme
MKEYHIDGFRFDLARMIDWNTIDRIREEAQKVNPNVILIAEPWGGDYDPAGFSDRGWASWNDQIRNGVKGQNPHDGLGFIFGQWQGENKRESLQRYLQGSLRQHGGQYLTNAHSINYLESHDDLTMGDFIRIGLKEISESQQINDIDRHAKLTATQLKLNKLAALFLFSSQGPVMIHSGQEYARSKVIAPTTAADPHVGKIDHNSYNKDNETNWLNYRHADFNQELLEYYQQLIQLRRNHEVFRRAKPEDYKFFETADSLFQAFKISWQDKNYLVLLNGNPRLEQQFPLPTGKWKVLADGQKVVSNPVKKIEKSFITVPSSSGMILIQ